MKRIAWLIALLAIPASQVMAMNDEIREGKETAPVAETSAPTAVHPEQPITDPNLTCDSPRPNAAESATHAPVPSTSAENHPRSILDETEDFVHPATAERQETAPENVPQLNRKDRKVEIRSRFPYDITQQPYVPLNPHFEPTSWQEKLCKWFIPGYIPTASITYARAEPREFVKLLGNSMRQLASFRTKLRNLIVTKSIINGIGAGFIAAKLLPRSPHKNIVATSLGVFGCGIAYWFNKQNARPLFEGKNYIAPVIESERLILPPMLQQNANQPKLKSKNYFRLLSNAIFKGHVSTVDGVKTGADVSLELLHEKMNRTPRDQQTFDQCLPTLLKQFEDKRTI